MSEEREPIIDALLEELLGEQQPPDLTQRILGAYDAATDSSVDVSRVTIEAADIPSTNGKNPPRIVAGDKRGTAKKRSKSLQTWASVAVVLIGAGGFFYWAELTKNPNLTNAPVTSTDRDPHLKQDPVQNAPERLAHKVAPPTVDEDYVGQEYVPLNPSLEDAVSPSPYNLVQPNNDNNYDFDPFESPTFQRELELSEPKSDSAMIATINSRLETRWKLVTYTPLKAVSDQQWFVRAMRFLMGRSPSGMDISRFSGSMDREEAVDKMMATRQFDARWAKFFAKVLIGRATTSWSVDQPELEKYLAQSFRDRKPFDQLTFELITAAGSNKPGNPDFNPATNFLLSHQQIQWIEGKKTSANKLGATEKVSQVFLGIQLQCARCHDHEGVTQDQYYQMVSFFTQMLPENTQKEGNVSKLSNMDYFGSDRSYEEADVFFTRHRIGEEGDGVGVSVYPTFIDGTATESKSGRVSVINRREALAKLIVTSDLFPRALVNRIWDEALGYGFTKPIEDMGEHNPPSHPELLDALAEEFGNSDFNIRPLMKWIVLSQAFDRRSRVDTDSVVGRPDDFTSFARIDQELLYRSVDGALGETSRAFREGGLPNLHAQIGNDEEQKLTPKQRSRLQANINAKTDFLQNRYGTLISQLAKNSNLSDVDRVIHLFLATVGRLPTDYERKRGVEIISAMRNLESALQEIGVLLLNSEEFVTQH